MINNSNFGWVIALYNGLSSQPLSVFSKLELKLSPRLYGLRQEIELLFHACFYSKLLGCLQA